MASGCASDGWQEYPHNPVLGGDLGVCFDPCVLPEAGGYTMWFSWRDKHAVARTHSLDGIHWSTPALDVAPQMLGGGYVEANRPSVVARPDGLRMWFTGQTKDHSAIFCARSADGLAWRLAAAAPVLAPERPWEKVAVMCPSVLWDNGLFRMWYSGGEQFEPDGIGYAESRDGVAWVRRDGPIFTPGTASWERAKVTAADVHRVGDWVYMFYAGFHDTNLASIGVARSRDGVTGWERRPGNPIIRPPGRADFFSWERNATYKAAALPERDGWKLWFNARRKHTEQIGLATHGGLALWP